MYIVAGVKVVLPCVLSTGGQAISKHHSGGSCSGTMFQEELIGSSVGERESIIVS